MVAAVRRGQALRAVARQLGVGMGTVAHWVARTKGQRLDRVDWSNRSRTAQDPPQTTAVEDRVLQARRDLTQSDRGAIAAELIRQTLSEQGVAAVPSVHTIKRILARRGVLDGRKRTRGPPPHRLPGYDRELQRLTRLRLRPTRCKQEGSSRA